MGPSVLARAPAKLNLALSVGPPSVDRMHPICSWMVTVDLHDDLLLTRLPEESLSRYAIVWHPDAKRRSDIDWSITQDLAVRAHLALERRCGRLLPVQMKLAKRIPVGGGLGGGSSDGAAMLHALNHLFELGCSDDELAEIASELGSDVAFLVHGGSAIVEGLGERVERHALPPELHAVLAFPETACPTREVYGAFDRMTVGARVDSARVRALAEFRATSRIPPHACFNDLAPPALTIAPTLADDLEELSALAERPAHVSGSGSTLFVLCDDQLHATALAEACTTRLNLPAVAVRTAPRAMVIPFDPTAE
ncbi:MAG: 4-(cytidine 5'-diphospho)-2-C-methyl-D-erythritol kinase [Phycisphaerae bacterium]|nr:4-(cytidine 5'-diphospho)-2-C-methyl-D-erythritol kinase [Phycisphaerae bacterium]